MKTKKTGSSVKSSVKNSVKKLNKSKNKSNLSLNFDKKSIRNIINFCNLTLCFCVKKSENINDKNSEYKIQ
jgi:hypothetical protein